jgi:hypothetical protein
MGHIDDDAGRERQSADHVRPVAAERNVTWDPDVATALDQTRGDGRRPKAVAD